jgi:hypothetical protein
MRIRVGHGFGTCPVHRTSPKSMSDTCLARVPFSGYVSCIGKVPSSRFLRQVGVVRCFGVQLVKYVATARAILREDGKDPS